MSRPACKSALCRDGYERDVCAVCNGSGEGPADGTRCRYCRGRGEVEHPCPHCLGTGHGDTVQSARPWTEQESARAEWETE